MDLHDVPNETDCMIVTDYTHSKLGELIERAVDNKLVDYCHVAPDVVVVSVGGQPFTFAPGEARAFLGNMVQGWIRTGERHKAGVAPVDAHVQRGPVPVAPTQKVRPSLSLQNHAGNSTLNGKVGGDGPVLSDETYVDAVLSCAAKLRLIEGYQKDRASHRIMLKTQATTADMSYFETLEYLTGSILDELRATPA